MVSLADLRAWNPGALNEICSVLQARTQILVHEGDDYGKTLPVEGWSGPAADDATAQHRSLMHGLDTIAAGAAILGKTIGQASDAITGVQHALTNAEELARKYGFQITDNGGVADTFAGKQAPPDLHPEDRARTHTQLVDEVAQILRTANDIDNDLASVLDRAAAGQFGTGDESTVTAAAADGMKDPGLTLPEPPPNATPAHNAAWWATLSDAGRNILIRDRPGSIGAMNGLPATDRDRANRIVLDRDYQDLHHQRDDIRHRLDGMKRSDPQQQEEYQALEKQLDALNGKIAGMDQIKTRLDQALPGQPPTYLLGINPANSGQAIVAIGNPDTAANVATYVPGTTAGLNDGMATDIGRSDSMAAKAAQLGSPSTSVITWVGYDAPQSIIPDAIDTSFADKAEPSLRNFQDGLGAAHHGAMNMTVIGHSYGTTVVGQTARDLGLPANNVVMVASPGVGVEHANQLHLDGMPQDQVGQHIYSTKAPTDPIPIMSNFDTPMADGIDPLGPDPTTGWFGGQRFDSAPSAPWTSHSDYWNKDSPSLDAMGKIIAGSKP
ncbi:alpha/beta hydrolase family protein [Amycolatopsis sulphurea]|uniref:Alpha/beta hydrolase family protein n=1 Tax=Amycolatopsis sulphurea TaxID=76022 RepID=A0A2A9FF38_9PSEU|nr:alpha/beta hydrolase [Amycolatopsis sulphurea]PFG49376.1 alpha/beta hydrolase family protein [Amycolatopsis sulphurea]